MRIRSKKEKKSQSVVEISGFSCVTFDHFCFLSMTMTLKLLMFLVLAISSVSLFALTSVHADDSNTNSTDSDAKKEMRMMMKEMMKDMIDAREVPGETSQLRRSVQLEVCAHVV